MLYTFSIGGGGIAATRAASTWRTTRHGYTRRVEPGLPVNLGNSLVNQITKVLQTTRGVTESQIEQRGYDEFDKLKKVHGDKLDERLLQAGLMVEDLEKKQPGLKNLLKSKGLGDDSLIANLLIGHAAIYHARKGRS